MSVVGGWRKGRPHHCSLWLPLCGVTGRPCARPSVGGLVVASFPALVVGASAWTVKPTGGASSWQVRIPSVRVHWALVLCVYEQRSSLIMGSLSCHQSRRRGPNWRGGRTRSREAVGRGRSVVSGTAPEAACPRRTFRSPVSRGAVCS